MTWSKFVSCKLKMAHQCQCYSRQLWLRRFLRAAAGMHQTRYTNEVLRRFGMADSKGISSPWAAGVLLKPDDELEKADEPFAERYSELCGSVIYLKVRPDVTYTVGKLCKFMKSPTSPAVQAVPLSGHIRDVELLSLNPFTNLVKAHEDSPALVGQSPLLGQ